jgi:hypothetical protein
VTSRRAPVMAVRSRSAAWALALGGLLTVAAGCLAWWLSAAAYIDNPEAVSSFSGNVVLLYRGQLAAYRPYTVGVEPWVIVGGVALTCAGVLLAAASWRPRGHGASEASRASTAE